MNKLYPINEIFFSLQGEGHNAGRAAVFIRLSGCNLQCPFCDTDHSRHVMMSAKEIILEAEKYDCGFVVLTGGEPSLWIDQDLIDRLHEHFEIAIETNGTHQLPNNIDWITLSPKQHSVQGAQVVIDRCNELKLIWEAGFDADKMNDLIENEYGHIAHSEIYIQPCDTGSITRNKEIIKDAVDYCLNNTDVKLSVQLHKILNIK